jgi:predicted ATPase
MSVLKNLLAQSLQNKEVLMAMASKDTKLFIELMLSRSIKKMQIYPGPVIFDRGIPDIICYAKGASLELAHAERAAKKYRYNDLVFFPPGWKEIYQTDDERKMSFEAVSQFGDTLRKIHLRLRYKVIDVPFDIPEERAKFIVQAVSQRV